MVPAWPPLDSCFHSVAIPFFFQATQFSQSYVDLSKANLWGDRQVLAVVSHVCADMLAFFSTVPDFYHMPVSRAVKCQTSTTCL